MRFLATSILLAASVGLSACSLANWNTVDRTTSLNTEDRPAFLSYFLGKKKDGLAIHLDAQQRLVLLHNGKYCAEPSPDALASYAAALGLGLGKPGAGAASVASALQGNAASIGLRTQSITLMRDALYRVCEATANKTLGEVGAATALARSQDLTAVILAIEQLTGAVAGNQVILTSEAGARTSTALIGNQETLEVAEKNVKGKEKELSKAQEGQKKLEETVKQKQQDVDDAQKTRDGTTQGTPEYQKHTDTLKTAKEERTEAQSNLENAKREVERQEGHYKQAVETRDAIREIREGALTQARATTAGFGRFGGTPIQRNQLSVEATAKIADTVRDLVKAVIDEDYTVESCRALITDHPNPLAGLDKARKNQILDGCANLVLADLENETQMLREEAIRSEPCQLDAIGKKIQAGLDSKSDRTLYEEIDKWLEEKKGKHGLRVTTVLRGCGYARLREELFHRFNKQLK